MNVFVQPNEQSQTCLNFVMARKRLMLIEGIYSNEKRGWQHQCHPLFFYIPHGNLLLGSVANPVGKKREEVAVLFGAEHVGVRLPPVGGEVGGDDLIENAAARTAWLNKQLPFDPLGGDSHESSVALAGGEIESTGSKAAASVATDAATVEEVGLQRGIHSDIDVTGTKQDEVVGLQGCSFETGIGGDALMEGVDDAEFEAGDFGGDVGEGDIDSAVGSGTEQTYNGCIVVIGAEAGEGKVVAFGPCVGTADKGCETGCATIGHVDRLLCHTTVVAGDEEREG